MFTQRLLIKILCIVLLAGLAGCSKGNDVVKSFAGNYAGTYSGDTSGKWTAVFGTDGSVTADITDYSFSSVQGKGSISAKGEFDLSTRGYVAERASFATWKGAFKIVDGVCSGSGTWSAGEGFEGTWEGKRID